MTTINTKSSWIHHSVFLLSIIYVLQLIFGDIRCAPNQYLMMIGGDGSMLYFNAIYHTIYGTSHFLESMNYMDPESLFMTDAQASFSYLFSLIHGIIPSIDHYVVGLIHVIFMIGIMIHFYLLYFINRKLLCPPILAFVLAICVGSMSPQLVRMSYGHFGLSYPFLIPMTILWLWTDPQSKGYTLLTFGFLMVCLFFGLNNPYILFIVAGLLMLYGLVASIWYRNIKKIWPLYCGVSLVAVLYVILHFLDPYDDRIGSQWGHFYFSSTIKGMLYDQHSLIFKLIKYFGQIEPGDLETYATLSLACLILIVLWIVIKTPSLMRKASFNHLDVQVTILCLSALLFFVYSSGFFNLKYWELLIRNISPLTMIKATGRLSWVTYYTFSILSVYFFSNLWRNSTKSFLKVAMMMLVMLWLLEGHIYLNAHAKVRSFDNTFTPDMLQKWIAPYQKEVDLNKYQALYTLPVIQTWLDNLLVEGDWTTQIHAQHISLATGLPWINSRLSRAPVGRSLDNVQLSSHPLIYKKLSDSFIKDEPILLVKGSSHSELSYGEKDLLSRATHVYHSKDVDLYELMPAQFNNHAIRDSLALQCKKEKAWYWYEGFESLHNTCGFQSNSGYLINEQWQDIVTIEIPRDVSGMYELSFWNYVNIDKFGMPVYFITVYNADKELISKEYVDSRNFIDTQDGWLRTSKLLRLEDQNTVVLSGQGRYPMCMDEVLLRNVDKVPVCLYDQEGVTIKSINNYYLVI